MISILQGTSKEGTSDVPIRVLEIPLDDGTKEYLATNLFDPTVTKDMFRELYFYRWPIMPISVLYSSGTNIVAAEYTPFDYCLSGSVELFPARHRKSAGLPGKWY